MKGGRLSGERKGPGREGGAEGRRVGGKFEQSLNIYVYVCICTYAYTHVYGCHEAHLWMLINTTKEIAWHRNHGKTSNQTKGSVCKQHGAQLEHSMVI